MTCHQLAKKMSQKYGSHFFLNPSIADATVSSLNLTCQTSMSDCGKTSGQVQQHCCSSREICDKPENLDWCPDCDTQSCMGLTSCAERSEYLNGYSRPPSRVKTTQGSSWLCPGHTSFRSTLNTHSATKRSRHFRSTRESNRSTCEPNHKSLKEDRVLRRQPSSDPLCTRAVVVHGVQIQETHSMWPSKPETEKD